MSWQQMKYFFLAPLVFLALVLDTAGLILASIICFEDQDGLRIFLDIFIPILLAGLAAWRTPELISPTPPGRAVNRSLEEEFFRRQARRC